MINYSFACCACVLKLFIVLTVHCAMFFVGHQYLDPRLPSVVHKTYGERVELVMRMRVCRQPQITWKHGTSELAVFSTGQLSGNRTIADRQLLVKFEYNPVDGVLTTSVILFTAKLSDIGDYTVETRVGDNATTAKTSLQLSADTSGEILSPIYPRFIILVD